MFKASADDGLTFGKPLKNVAHGRPVLYLDFDGVLHPHDVHTTKRGIELRAPGHTLFEGAPILESILEPYPEVLIVLSTSWVMVKGFSFARRQLPESLASRVIGATFHKRLMDRYEFLRYSRGEQIASDVNRRGAGAWVALDDDTDGWPPFYGDRLIACDSNTGLLSISSQDQLAASLQSIHTAKSRPRPAI